VPARFQLQALRTIEAWHARVAHARATVPAPCPAPCPARSFLAQELAGQIVDEVQPVAGGADHGSVRGLGCVVGYGGQPMLHVHSGLRAFVNDRAGHRISMMMPAGVENYVSIRRCYRSVSSRGEPWARKSAGILGAKQLSGAAVAKMQPGARRAGHHRCVFMLAAALPVSAVLHLQIGQMKIRFIPPLSALPAMKPWSAARLCLRGNTDQRENRFRYWARDDDVFIRRQAMVEDRQNSRRADERIEQWNRDCGNKNAAVGRPTVWWEALVTCSWSKPQPAATWADRYGRSPDISWPAAVCRPAPKAKAWACHNWDKVFATRRSCGGSWSLRPRTQEGAQSRRLIPVPKHGAEQEILKRSTFRVGGVEAWRGRPLFWSIRLSSLAIRAIGQRRIFAGHDLQLFSRFLGWGKSRLPAAHQFERTIGQVSKLVGHPKKARGDTTSGT